MSRSRGTLLIIAALAAGLSVAGCNQSGRPRGGDAAVSAAWPQAGATGREAPAVADGPMRTYTVLPGDTVYGVAGRFGIPIRALIEINDLAAPFILRPGRQLAIPARREHIVQPGETVYGIARIYGIDQSTLIRVNDIPPPYVIRAGEPLRLPAPVEIASLANPSPAASAAPRTGAVSVETLPPLEPGSAPTAGASSAPQSTAPPTVTVPQEAPVPLPAPPSVAATPNAPSGDTETRPAAPAAGERAPGPEPEAVDETARVIPAAVPKPPPLSDGKFLWPVNGRIVSGFGPKKGGLHNDGINIAAPRGTPVRAVESGVVAYAGNELRGFGNLLLIRHADGWISAYAHNDSLLVQRGDQVSRGQTIARVGSSGNVSSPQLHFELRRGSRSINPLEHLGAQGAALTPGADRAVPPDLG